MQSNAKGAFIDEVLAALGAVRSGLGDLCGGSTDRLAAARVGLSALRERAGKAGLPVLCVPIDCICDTIARLARGDIPVNEASLEMLESMLLRFEAILDGVSRGDEGGESEVGEIVSVYMGLAGFAEVEERIESQTVQEAVSDEVMEVFMLEAREHLDSISQNLAYLESSPQSGEFLKEIRRGFHTLKGASSMVGLDKVASFAHKVEDLLDRLSAGDGAAVVEAIGPIYTALDLLSALIAGQEGLDERIGDACRLIDCLVERLPSATPQGPIQGAVEAPSGSLDEGFLRVAAGRVNTSYRLAEELMVKQSSLKDYMSRFREARGELEGCTNRLRELLRAVDREDAIGGALGEVTRDFETILGALESLYSDIEQYRHALYRLVGEISESIMSFRMVPLGSLSQFLQRSVRATSQELGKSVELRLQGEDVEVDKLVLDRIKDPLIHLMRNSVYHGIEPPHERLGMGKPEKGVVSVSASYEGGDVVIRVSDDGRGIDCEAVRESAVQKGILSEEGSRLLSTDEIYQLVFLPGLSTAKEVSGVSGRGVGMDVVVSAVKGLGGAIDVASRAGKGTTFTIRIPSSLSVTRVMMASARGSTFAIPLTSIREVARAEPNQLTEERGRLLLTRGERPIPAIDLGEVLNLPPCGSADESLLFLILAGGGGEVALSASAVFGVREVVVKSLGPLLRRIPGVIGATITGEGSVRVVLDPEYLVSEALALWSRPRVACEGARGAEPPQSVPCVMVVDDSVSIRHAVAEVVGRTGLGCIQARDGLEALEMLHGSSSPPRLIITDIEMPRMDGFELIKAVRAGAFSGIPVVAVSSRMDEDTKRKALELGANEYVAKPFGRGKLEEVIVRLAGMG